MDQGERTRKKIRAFSLLELLIVIAIIGALVALLLPNFQGQTSRAQLDACWGNIRNINMAIALYRNNSGYTPAFTCGSGGTFNGTATTGVLSNTSLFPDGPPTDLLASNGFYYNCYDSGRDRCLRNTTTCGGATNQHPGPTTAACPGANFSNANAQGTVCSHTMTQ